MKRHLVIVAGLSIFSAAVVGAQQTNVCPAGGYTAPLGTPDRQKATQDVCQMAVDVYQFIAPQLGVSMSGGNATMGQGGTLGGLGHFAVGLRGNVIAGDLPNFSKFPTPSDTGRISYGRATGFNSLPSKHQIIGLPTADVAVGLFQGIPLGLTNVLGVDGLLSATYVPKVSQSNFSITPKNNLQLGYGVRLGILQESIIVPGLSFSYLKRDLPTTTLIGTSPDMDVNVNDFKVNTSAWRITASKSLLLFGVAAGVGQDKYDQSANIQATAKNLPFGLANQTSDVIKLSQSMTRTNLFADFSFNFVVGKLVAEIGQVSGGKASTYSAFSGGAADKSRLYGSVGLRVGF